MHYSSSQDSLTASWRLIPSHLLRTARGDVGKYKFCAPSNVPNAGHETKPFRAPPPSPPDFRNSLLFLVLWQLQAHPCLTAPWMKGSWGGCMDVMVQAHRGAFIPRFTLWNLGWEILPSPLLAPGLSWLRLLPQDFLLSASSLQGIHSQKPGAGLHNKNANGERWVSCSIFKLRSISLYLQSLVAQSAQAVLASPGAVFWSCPSCVISLPFFIPFIPKLH